MAKAKGYYPGDPEIPGSALNDGAPLHPHNAPKPKGEIPPEENEKFPAAVPIDPGLLANMNALIQEKAKAIETAEAKPPVRRKLDPELKAMDAVCELLEDLNEQQRWRVINWALSRFMVENNGNLPKSTTQG